MKAGRNVHFGRRKNYRFDYQFVLLTKAKNCIFNKIFWSKGYQIENNVLYLHKRKTSRIV